MVPLYFSDSHLHHFSERDVKLDRQTDRTDCSDNCSASSCDTDFLQGVVDLRHTHILSWNGCSSVKLLLTSCSAVYSFVVVTCDSTGIPQYNVI